MGDNITGMAEAAMGTTFPRQQRRHSNLLQCMDQDGNIDAFRYIEYSRQRRMEFLQRADFICKLKSTIRMQHQHQQMYRSASLPGMTAMPAVPSVQPAMNEAFSAGFASPESNGNTPFSDTLKSLTARINKKRETAMPNAAAALRLRRQARSASMPFVSSFATNKIITGTKTAVSPASVANDTGANQRNAESESNDSGSRPAQRRRLRKEEFEAAEALLFGMRRSSMDTTSSPGGTGSDKLGNGSSSEEERENSVRDFRGSGKAIDGLASKKRKMPQGGIHSRSEEMETELSVVSAE